MFPKIIFFFVNTFLLDLFMATLYMIGVDFFFAICLYLMTACIFIKLFPIPVIEKKERPYIVLAVLSGVATSVLFVTSVKILF